MSDEQEPTARPHDLDPQQERVATLVTAVGYGGNDRYVVGVQHEAGRPVFVAGGTVDGRALDADAER